MEIKVEDKIIGHKGPCFIIAEVGINHNGKVEIAKRLIDSAKLLGADAVKFQTFSTERLLSKNIIIPKHCKSIKSFFETIKEFELSRRDHLELSEYCKKTGIIFISTPLDYESVDLLYDLGVPLFKIASCDLDNLPLLRYIAKKGKPIILSTGMGTLSEVAEAIEAIEAQKKTDIVLLHCVSEYPPRLDEINLNAMITLKNAFNKIVGYSDHTTGITIPLAAVALGAKVLEKHFTLDKSMEGPDHAVSADPDDLKNLIIGIRGIEKSLGTGEKIPSAEENKMKNSFRRSIVANTDIKKGQVFTQELLTMKRPGTGISPKYQDIIIGKVAKRDILYDNFIQWEDF